jgi:hypothetical protein
MPCFRLVAALVLFGLAHLDDTRTMLGGNLHAMDCTP